MKKSTIQPSLMATTINNQYNFFSTSSIKLDNSSPNNKIRYNYSVECEKGVNEQINLELYASYFYTALAAYFDQPTVALPGVAGFFQAQSNEERRHANSLIRYQNGRGGKVSFTSINTPPDFAAIFNQVATGPNGLNIATRGFELAIDVERSVYDQITQLYQQAEMQRDFALTGYLQGLIDEQVKSLKELQEMLTKSKRMVNDYWFDQLLASSSKVTEGGEAQTN